MLTQTRRVGSCLEFWVPLSCWAVFSLGDREKCATEFSQSTNLMHRPSLRFRIGSTGLTKRARGFVLQPNVWQIFRSPDNRFRLFMAPLFQARQPAVNPSTRLAMLSNRIGCDRTLMFLSQP